MFVGSESRDSETDTEMDEKRVIKKVRERE